MRQYLFCLLVVLCFSCGTGSGSTTPSDVVSPPDTTTPDTAVEDTAVEDTNVEDIFNPHAICEQSVAGTECDLDENPCTLDACDDSGQCVETNKTEDCSTEQAQQPCWTWTCNPKGGCVVAVFVEDLPCDDGNACTENDTCQNLDFKTCLGTPIPIDDGNTCTLDQCKDGTITHENIEGKPCETNGQSGICEGGSCTPSGSCTPPCPADTSCVNGECKPTCTPVDGDWSDWLCTPCSKSCGGGVSNCTRQCNNPAASCGGLTCPGPDTKEETCNTQECGNELPLGVTVYDQGEAVILGDVPGGVTSMDVALWGGGGGGGGPGTGGGGAFAHGTITVQPGDKIELRVAGNGGKYGGGGGASYVFVNGTIVLVAAGGGGGGSDGCSGCHDPSASHGGAGGGVGQSGQDGVADNKYNANMGGGGGATASAGGAGGVADNQSMYDNCTTKGEPGGAHKGGRDGTSSQCQLSPIGANYHLGGGKNSSGNGSGGGGGSGYYGGGSGAAMGTYNGGGGGGGSSWSDAATVTVNTSEGGNLQMPGGTSNPHYQGQAGHGGDAQTDPFDANLKGSDGKPGLIVITL